MNIQIYGKAKCFDTKKAERYFKERRIKYQYVDIRKYGLSKGEYQSVRSAVGSLLTLIDEKSKEYEDCNIRHMSSPSVVEEQLLANPGMFVTPIVRNGRKATVGYKPEVWGAWE
jgi:arsenate reductase-like glutaredoxin family protein